MSEFGSGYSFSPYDNYGQSGGFSTLGGSSASGGGGFLGMDPVTWAGIGTMGANFLGGLLGGGMDQQEVDQRYWTTQGMHAEANQARLLEKWMRETFGDRAQMPGAQLAGTRAQTGLLQQMFGQRAYGFDRAKDIYGQAGSMMGKPVFDPGASMGLLQQNMKPAQQQLMAQYGKSGMGGGSMMGALGNLQNQYMAKPMYESQERAAYAGASRDQWLMDLQSRLFG